jgi:hypothetical protein
MKKLFLISLVLFLVIALSKQEIYGLSEYEGFQDLSLTTGKLLSKFSEGELKEYYKKVTKTKFSGWNTYTINDSITVNYIKSTLFEIYNDGTSVIHYEKDISYESTNKFVISVVGQIGIKTGKKAKIETTEFKDDLDASLKLDVSYAYQNKKSETEKMKFDVNPGTKYLIAIVGSGKITNGVAAKYFFWIRTKLGGYEIFQVSSEYNSYRIMTI